MNDCDHIEAVVVDCYKNGWIKTRCYRCSCGEVVHTIEHPVPAGDLADFERAVLERAESEQ